jgi:hypothetical protein
MSDDAPEMWCSRASGDQDLRGALLENSATTACNDTNFEFLAGTFRELESTENYGIILAKNLEIAGRENRDQNRLLHPARRGLKTPDSFPIRTGLCIKAIASLRGAQGSAFYRCSEPSQRGQISAGKTL